MPSRSSTPWTMTSDLKPAIRLGGKLTTQTTVEADVAGLAAGLRELLYGGDQGRAEVDGEELLGLDSWRNIAEFGYL